VKIGSAQYAAFIPSDPILVRHDEPRFEGKTARLKDRSFTRRTTIHSLDTKSTASLAIKFLFPSSDHTRSQQQKAKT
jgi:hypothetical protein